jgi:hypothetical protein
MGRQEKIADTKKMQLAGKNKEDHGKKRLQSGEDCCQEDGTGSIEQRR